MFTLNIDTYLNIPVRQYKGVLKPTVAHNDIQLQSLEAEPE
jgi:hypothetical protein